MSKKIWFSILTAVLIAALGGAWLTVDAQAQGGGGLRDRLRKLRPVVGQVTAISADAISIKSLKGEALSYSIDAATRFRSRSDGQGEEATIDDVQVGLWVSVVTVKKSASGAAGTKLLARAIVLLPEDLDPANAQTERGRITNVNASGSSFTLETRRGGSVTMRVDSDTLYKGDVTVLADLQVGMTAVVVAEKQSNGDLLAYSVRAGMPKVRRAGEVAAVNAGANQFTIKLRRDGAQVTLTVNDRTRFRSKDGSVKSLADLKAGARVLVQAQEVGQDAYLAHIVLVLPQR